MPDYEAWHALHDACQPPGCGGCSFIDVDWPEEDWEKIKIAARLLGEEPDVFIHKALAEKMLDKPAPIE